MGPHGGGVGHVQITLLARTLLYSQEKNRLYRIRHQHQFRTTDIHCTAVCESGVGYPITTNVGVEDLDSLGVSDRDVCPDLGTPSFLRSSPPTLTPETRVGAPRRDPPERISYEGTLPPEVKR